MRVSVVIPCHNSLRFLPETVESVLAQTFEDFELVLVDDGGTDDLAGWVAGRTDPRIRLIRQENAGVSATRNRGVAEARGELVAFLDSDDVWDPTTLGRLVECFDRDPGIGLAYSGYDVIDSEGVRSGRVIVSTWEGDVWERFVTRNPVAASSVMIPVPVFTEVGGFRVNRDRFPIDVEDWELWVRIAADHRVAVVSEPLLHHRRHDTNSSSDVESLEAAYDYFLDTVFADAPSERQHLRPLATARSEVILAWHSLNYRKNPARALDYRRSAARHAPAVRRTFEYWRLGAAARVLRVTGDPGYAVVRSANRVARRMLTRVPLERFRSEGTFTP